jgi:cobalt-zinc-cadmium efflux system outer membrane protein
MLTLRRGLQGLCFALLLTNARAAAQERLASTGAAPELSEVVRLAARRAPEVVLGAADIDVARAEYAGARLPPVQNPYVEITAEKGYGTPAQRSSFLASLWLPLEVAGERSRRTAETDALVRWREAGLAEIRAHAVGEALRAFGSVLASSGRVHVLEVIVESAAREAALYRSRLEAGDALLREMKLAEAEAARSRTLLEAARADFEVALEALNHSTGMTYERAPAGSIEAPPLDPILAKVSESRAPGPKASAAEAAYLERKKLRARQEAYGPLSLMFQVGAGDLGDRRVGGGFAYTFPAFRRNQAERARAEAQGRRALAEMKLKRDVVSRKVRSIITELERVRRAVRVLTAEAIPAEEAAVEAAVETQRSGKGDWLTVLVSRRDLGLMRLERLDLVEREWRLLGEITALTGYMP